MARWVIVIGLLLALLAAATATLGRGLRELPAPVATGAAATTSSATTTTAPVTAPGTASRTTASTTTAAPRAAVPLVTAPSTPARSRAGAVASAAPLLLPIARAPRALRVRRAASRTSRGRENASGPAVAPEPAIVAQPVPTVLPDATAIAPVATTAEQQADAIFANDAPAEALVRLSAYRLPAERASVLIVNVPVPEALRADSAEGRAAVAYRIASDGAARVVGRMRGMVAPGGSVVRATISVRRSATAGRNKAATVEFRDTRGRRYLVPVELNVLAEQRATLALDDEYISAVRGGWTGVGFLVQNGGNAPDALGLHVEVPLGWRSVVSGMPLQREIEAGATVRGLVRVWIPSQYAPGQARVRVVLRRGAQVVDSRDLHVSVDDARGQARPGPSVGLTVATASGADGSRATGYAMTVDGSIADSVSISARATFSSSGVGAAGYGLARAGVADGPPSLALRSPRAGAMAGAIGVQRSELSGYFVNGLGAAADVKVGRTTVAAFGGRPFGFNQQSIFSAGAGRLAGLSLARNGGRLGDLSLQGVALRDEVGTRQLSALTLESRIASIGGGELTSEVGYRAHADGAGAGAAVAFQRVVGGSLLDLRAVHAPGGSLAYARATDDLSAMFSQRIGSTVLLSTGAWHQRDRNAALGRFAGDGWFVMPTMDVPRINSTVGVELRGSRFASVSQAGRFANGEQQATAMFDSRYRAGYLTVRSGVARLTRSIDFTGTTVPAVSGMRADLRAALGVTSDGGRFEATWVSQQFSGGARFYPRQQSVGARVDGLRVPRLAAAAVTANADVQRLVLGATTGANWSARGGVSASLPGRLGQASLQAEYNPYLLSSVGGRNGLLYTLRLSRGFAMPRMTATQTHRVFVDANGNGARDGGERGAAGIALKCGDMVVVTDADGRFSCQSGRDAVLDVRTLPAGVVAPSASGPRARSSTDFALRPLASRVVRLVLAAGDSLQVRSSDLEAIVVTAHDSSGATWVARSVGNGVFSFDALPVGRFEIEIDASAVAEPLRPATARPVLLVRPDEMPATMEIEMRTRSVRVRQLGTRRLPAPGLPARGDGVMVGTPAVTQENHTRQRQ
ncbi:MAG: hypothetical protein IT355_14780 [Gemmatimonadaceae bacterium]|nr:hypothetical protein [Gemmatimonadaceae bacterium]